MKILLIIVLILVIGVGGLYFARNMLVESAVEKGSSYALGVDTDLGSAGLEFSGGTLDLNDFEVANPEGYKSDNFLVIKKGILDVNEGSLLDDEVVVDSFVIDGIELTFEQNDTKGNYKDILDYIKKMNLTSSSESEQKFQIKKVSIRNISVNTLYNILGKTGEKKFDVPDINMSNLGGDNGATIAQVTSKIIQVVTTKAAESNANIPNMDAIKDKANEALDNAKDDASKKAEELGKSLLGK